MLDSHTYHQANMLQKTHALDTFLEYSQRMLWRNDGQDTILDIGCADGSVTEEVLAALVPQDYKIIVGVDINPEFIKRARKRPKNGRVVYKVMDIAGDITLDMVEFDHITSFFCLHWVEDKKKTFQNIYQLLAKGGDCLFTLATNHNCYKAVKIMSLMDKWRHCFQDLDLTVAPFKFEPYFVETLKRIFKEIGFRHFDVDSKPWDFDHGDVEAYRNFIRSFNPFGHKLSEEQYEEYVDAFLQILWMLDNEPLNSTITRGEFITIYAQK